MRRRNPLLPALAVTVCALPLLGAGEQRKTIVLPVEDPTGAKATYKMGFSQPDKDYLRSIPREARTVALDSALLLDDRRFRPIALGLPQLDVSDRKKEVARFRSFEAMPGADKWVPRKIWRDRVGDYDQWWLQDAKGFVAVISRHVETDQLWFFEIRGTSDNPNPNARYIDGDEVGLVAAGHDYCYGCHPSGLRKIIPRKDDPEIDWKILEKLNAAIKDAGMGNFGKSVDHSQYGEAVSAKTCTKCHNNKRRGKLYPLHAKTVDYKLRQLQSMPPRFPVKGDEAMAILKPLGQRADRWFAKRCKGGDMSACKMRGLLHIEGSGGLPEDVPKGAKMLEGACNAGDPVGCFTVAVLHKEGQGVPQNDETALGFLKKACDLKDGNACAILAREKGGPPPKAAATSGSGGPNGPPQWVIRRLEALKARGTIPETALMGAPGPDGAIPIYDDRGQTIGRLQLEFSSGK